MNIEQFADKFNMTVKAAGQYLKKNGIPYQLIVKDGHRCFLFHEDGIKKGAEIRERTFMPYDPETEHDRVSITKALRLRGLSEYDRRDFVKQKNFPDIKRRRLKSQKIWDKKEVDTFISAYFGGEVKPKQRTIKGYSADLIWFCTGRYWRYGESLTTIINHCKEV